MSDREIAEAHWKYTKKIIDKMVELVGVAYVEAMIHGMKHGCTSNKTGDKDE